MKEVMNMSPCAMGTFPYVIQQGDTLWQLAQRYNTTIYAISAVNTGVNLNYLYVGQVVCMPSTFAPPNLRPSIPHADRGFSKSEIALMNKMRELWEEHVAWTRMTIISIAANLPDTDLVTNRLLRNPNDFAAELKPLYGNDKASKFADLFKSHLVIAAQLVKAVKSGDSKTTADAEKRWYVNADEIAAFLASINPYWSGEEWKSMLHEHLSLTKSEAVERLNRNYAADIKLYDEIQNQALKMADMMSGGIIKQFLNHF